MHAVALLGRFSPNYGRVGRESNPDAFDLESTNHGYRRLIDLASLGRRRSPSMGVSLLLAVEKFERPKALAETLAAVWARIKKAKK